MKKTGRMDEWTDEENWTNGRWDGWTSGKNWVAGRLDGWTAGILDEWNDGLLECWDARQSLFSGLLSERGYLFKIFTYLYTFTNIPLSQSPKTHLSNCPFIQSSNHPIVQ